MAQQAYQLRISIRQVSTGRECRLIAEFTLTTGRSGHAVLDLYEAARSVPDIEWRMRSTAPLSTRYGVA
eukprot:1080420-Rhodomonas_salina.2